MVHTLNRSLKQLLLAYLLEEQRSKLKVEKYYCEKLGGPQTGDVFIKRINVMVRVWLSSLPRLLVCTGVGLGLGSEI